MKLKKFAALTISIIFLSSCGNISAPDSPPPFATHINATPPRMISEPAAKPAAKEPSEISSCASTASFRPTEALPEPGKMPTNSTMAKIQKRGHLIVGLDIGSNLFSFRNPRSGLIEGFDVDIAKEIARAIFNDPERIEYQILSPEQRINSLASGTVDIVAKTISVSCNSTEVTNFSAVYYQASQRIMVLRNSGITSIADLNHRRVCAVRETTSMQRIQQLAGSAQIYSATSWADCLVALQQWQIDAISTDDAILAGLASQDPYTEVIGPSLGVEPYAIGIRKGVTDFVRFVNGVLENIKANGTWSLIYSRWLGALGPAPYPPIAQYRD